jgi:hypothetical protein
MTFHPALLIAQEFTYSDNPSIEFLEFLGEFETRTGEWIDPNEFTNETYASAEEQEEETVVIEEENDD